MKKKLVLVLIISFVGASMVSNLDEKLVRGWIEKLYELITGIPMVYDISKTDEKGIPFVIEGTIGKQRNPVIVCNKALEYYSKFISGDSSQLILFLNCSNWLVENATQQNNFSVLPYRYNWLSYHMIAPWRSGLANGVALQVLIKAHAVTGDKKYLEVAKQILNSFYVDVSNGGVTYLSKSDGWWFEELADNGGHVSRVLNGHMFALIGIHEYFLHTHDSAAQYLFGQGLLALKKNLPKYDKGGGHSYYDLLGTPANVKYHQVHIDLLNKLFKITNDSVLQYYENKWRPYKHPKLTTRLVTLPVKRIDVAIWLFNFALVGAMAWAAVFLFFPEKRKS